VALLCPTRACLSFLFPFNAAEWSNWLWKKGINCLSVASFYPRHRQLWERGQPKAKIVGGLSFAYFSLAVKEKYDGFSSLALKQQIASLHSQ